MATGSVDRGDLSLSVLFPSEYVKAEDLSGRPVTVTITGGNIDAVPMTGGKREQKLVFTLAKTPKRWVVGKTNAAALALLLCTPPSKDAPGNAPKWNLRETFGKKVTLVADEDTMKGEPCAAIRIAGSPDATADRTARYTRAWRGKRLRGALCSRLKTALQLLALGAPPPVENDEPTPDYDDGPSAAPAEVDEVFGAYDEPPPVDAVGSRASSVFGSGAAVEPTPEPTPTPTTKTKRAREPGED